MLRSEPFDILITDHPAWIRTGKTDWIRAVRDSYGVGRMICAHASIEGDVTINGPACLSFSDTVRIIDCEKVAGTSKLEEEIRTLGRVARWANTDAWDAVATAIIRQVIRAGHAKSLYRTVCERFGERVSGTHDVAYLFPTQHQLQLIPDEELVAAGLGFKIAALRAAADFFVTAEEDFECATYDAIEDLQRIRRVGSWTARAAVADQTNDFSGYPHGDLAIRTWAAHMDPSVDWPQNDTEFAALWQTMAKGDLARWTVSAIAYGVRHGVRSDEKSWLAAGYANRSLVDQCTSPRLRGTA
ncbi:hypothetical protein G6031_03765 [Dietzia sp. CQ4]|uniref:hypothetical protein n=1 Tax=Dietzia TaxID=37914 RepID=UPI0015FB116A|nr:hypothetical protein [Dietzia sp. CQ4]MBB1033505.1 hypothetical protein [Dietzia sp. CQ4]